MNLKLLREKILTEINQQKVYEKYIGKELKLGSAIRSPLRDKDRNPSFNIYEKNGQILWKDFAEENGNVIDFTMRLFEIDFKTAIQKISSDFDIENYNLSIMKAKPRFSLKQEAETIHIDIKVVEKHWDKESLGYWASYGLDLNDLKDNDIHNIESFTYQNKDGRTRIGQCFKGDPIFQVLYPSGNCKIYRPLSKNKAFKWRSNVKHSIDFWGINRINKFDEIVVIASGIKDALCVQKHLGMRATFPNSETSYPTLEQYQQLALNGRTVCVLFDNDETGKKQAEKMKEKFLVLDIGHFLSDKFKDVADYYHHKVTNQFDNDPLKQSIYTFLHEKNINPIADQGTAE